MIRSKIDYGSIAYGAANRRIIRMLNTIKNCTIHLSLGPFKSISVASILSMAVEPPLSSRIKLLFETKYMIKIAKHQENLVYNNIIITIIKKLTI